MLKESERIKSRMLVFLGIGYLLLGFIIVLSSSRITGLVVLGDIKESVGYFFGILFFVIGILVIMSARTHAMEGLTLRVYSSKNEKNEEKAYNITDPERHLTTKGSVSLGEFRKEISMLRKEHGGEDLVKIVLDSYGPALHRLANSQDEEKARIACHFLEVLEPSYKPEKRKAEEYKVSNEDKRRIKSVFKQWRGERLTPRQKEILKDYNLIFVESTPHSKVFYAGTDSFVTVGNTPSHDMEDYTTTRIINMIEKIKNNKKSR